MTTPDNIQHLPLNSVFVFGSNTSGSHAGGAARLAQMKFGAADGIGEGLVGQSYAFPTLDHNLEQLPLSYLEYSARLFTDTAAALPSVTFYLTKVGTGIAGYPENTMKELFKDTPPNVVKPEGW